MELAVIGSAQNLSVSEEIFGRAFSQDLVHQVVVAYRNAGRAGTKAQKSRADVSGTTKKSKKQTGGGARHGALTAPIFVGGGVTFAARPRSFAQKVNRKMYRAGVASILSQLVREDRLAVIDALEVDAPKTRLFAQKMKALGFAGSVLVVTDKLDDNVFLSSRNLPDVLVLETREVDPVSLIRFNNVLLTRAAVAQFEEMLG
jgi:large subunit ribosomal protein L4